MVGFASRPIALVIAINMVVAYITADREALLSVLSDPSKFYAAASYTFLFASTLIVIFGLGKYSADGLLMRR